MTLRRRSYANPNDPGATYLPEMIPRHARSLLVLAALLTLLATATLRFGAGTSDAAVSSTLHGDGQRQLRDRAVVRRRLPRHLDPGRLLPRGRERHDDRAQLPSLRPGGERGNRRQRRGNVDLERDLPGGRPLPVRLRPPLRHDVRALRRGRQLGRRAGDRRRELHAAAAVAAAASSLEQRERRQRVAHHRSRRPGRASLGTLSARVAASGKPTLDEQGQEREDARGRQVHADAHGRVLEERRRADAHRQLGEDAHERRLLRQEVGCVSFSPPGSGSSSPRPTRRARSPSASRAADARQCARAHSSSSPC